MIRFFICMTIFLLSHSLRGQEDFRIGKSYAINSSILNEDCYYWISLPNDYSANENKSYPLVLLLDGEKYFPVVNGICHMYQNGRSQLMPEAVLVGLKSNDRARDFTPTSSAAGRDGKSTPNKESIGGSAKLYTRFLAEELLPLLISQYSISSDRLLIGHSYAGLFALNTFLFQPHLFSRYLVLDPSVWWDNGWIIKQYEERLSDLGYNNNQKLYLGFATKEVKSRSNINVEKAEGLIGILDNKQHYYQLTYQYFTNESHGTVFIPGFLDGIKKLYEQ